MALLQLLKKALLLLEMVLLLLPKMAGNGTVAVAKKGWWQWHFNRVLSTPSKR
jgi:hypothetical protein